MAKLPDDLTPEQAAAVITTMIVSRDPRADFLMAQMTSNAIKGDLMAAAVTKKVMEQLDATMISIANRAESAVRRAEALHEGIVVAPAQIVATAMGFWGESFVTAPFETAWKTVSEPVGLIKDVADGKNVLDSTKNHFLASFGPSYDTIALSLKTPAVRTILVVAANTVGNYYAPGLGTVLGTAIQKYGEMLEKGESPSWEDVAGTAIQAVAAYAGVDAKQLENIIKVAGPIIEAVAPQLAGAGADAPGWAQSIFKVVGNVSPAAGKLLVPILKKSSAQDAATAIIPQVAAMPPKAQDDFVPYLVKLNPMQAKVVLAVVSKLSNQNPVRGNKVIWIVKHVTPAKAAQIASSLAALPEAKLDIIGKSNPKLWEKLTPQAILMIGTGKTAPPPPPPMPLVVSRPPVKMVPISLPVEPDVAPDDAPTDDAPAEDVTDNATSDDDAPTDASAGYGADDWAAAFNSADAQLSGVFY